MGVVSVVLILVCAALVPQVLASDRDCDGYYDIFNNYLPSKKCWTGFCCGSCIERDCCFDSFRRITEDEQDDCPKGHFNRSRDSSIALICISVAGVIAIVLSCICCCVCPCCCIYKMCRRPQPVIATTTHTTVISSTPAHYPQQPTASVGQPQAYQGASYPGYQAVPPQPHPTAPYPGAAYAPGPPPPYQEAVAHGFGPVPYSQAAFSPGQPSYPLQPPAQGPLGPSYSPNAPPSVGPQADYLAQPAYNPDFAPPPAKPGY